MSKSTLSPRERMDYFVDHATGTLQHPTAQRVDLPALGTSARFALSKQGKLTAWEYHLIDPQYLESAAGRLRKFMVTQSEPIYLGTVINTLNQCLTLEDRSQYTDNIKTNWTTFGKQNYFSFYSVNVATGEGTGNWIKDRDIAYEWLYGDYLHADPKYRKRTRHVPEWDKQQAALLWVKDSFLLLHALHATIRLLDDHGRIGDPKWPTK